MIPHSRHPSSISNTRTRADVRQPDSRIGTYRQTGTGPPLRITLVAGGDHDKPMLKKLIRTPRRIYGLRNARLKGQQHKDNKEVYQGAFEAVAEVDKPDRQQNAEDYHGGRAVFISKQKV